MYLRVYPLYYIQLIMGSQVATRLLYYYWYVNKEYAQYSDSQEWKLYNLKVTNKKIGAYIHVSLSLRIINTVSCFISTMLKFNDF